MEDIKLVVVIQCEFSKKRCSGFHCMQSFYNREHLFKNYSSDEEIRFMSIQCGGCNGKGVTILLKHISKLLAREGKIEKDNVAIHLASCMAFENYHSQRCMFIDYIKSEIKKSGYDNIIEGTYISKKATKRREEGIYQKPYPKI